jgi:hypothetical protein
MTALSNRQDRSVTPQPIIEDRFQEIARLQNRLDEAEAEMAALTALAHKRGFGFLRSEGRPLLEEMDLLVRRLRQIILEEGADSPPLRTSAVARPVRGGGGVYAERLATPRLLHN